jgi:hypothetical protein
VPTKPAANAAAGLQEDDAASEIMQLNAVPVQKVKTENLLL